MSKLVVISCPGGFLGVDTFDFPFVTKDPKEAVHCKEDDKDGLALLRNYVNHFSKPENQPVEAVIDGSSIYKELRIVSVDSEQKLN